MDTNCSHIVPQPVMSDRLLLEQAYAGDESAFETLVHRYETQLYRFVCASLGNDEAEDVVQFVWVQLYRCLSHLQSPTGYATSEPRGGESPEKLAKTAEMWLPERKRVRKGEEEDDRSCRPDPGRPDKLAEHAALVWGGRRGDAGAPGARNPQSDRGTSAICASSDGQV